MISAAALEQLKHEHRCDELAGKLVTLRKHGKKLIGPCPICSRDPQARDDGRFECDDESWVCAACADGGDVIALVQRIEGMDFLAAVDWLGGAREIDAATARWRDEEREQRRIERERTSQQFRERERVKLHDIWLRAAPLAGSTAEKYLALRGLTRMPIGARLRCVEAMPYFLTGDNKAEIVHRGPAMVAAIVGGDGRFAGLHFTYLDLAQPNGKLALAHPQSGELLDAKKSRGSKAGGHVELTSPPLPARLVMGEGIETTAAVWLALDAAGRDLSRTAFWPALDLGNLAGKAKDSVAHPMLKEKRGRPRRVPGPVPDLDTVALAIPDSVEELVLLGDGDSDPYLTRCAIARAGARYAR